MKIKKKINDQKKKLTIKKKTDNKKKLTIKNNDKQANKKVVMDIIYKHETNFIDDNNFSIDLTANNEIQNIFFKGRDEWLVSGLKLKTKKFEGSDEYKEVKKCLI